MLMVGMEEVKSPRRSNQGLKDKVSGESGEMR